MRMIAWALERVAARRLPTRLVSIQASVGWLTGLVQGEVSAMRGSSRCLTTFGAPTGAAHDCLETLQGELRNMSYFPAGSPQRAIAEAARDRLAGAAAQLDWGAGPRASAYDVWAARGAAADLQAASRELAALINVPTDGVVRMPSIARFNVEHGPADDGIGAASGRVPLPIGVDGTSYEPGKLVRLSAKETASEMEYIHGLFDHPDPIDYVGTGPFAGAVDAAHSVRYLLWLDDHGVHGVSRPALERTLSLVDQVVAELHGAEQPLELVDRSRVRSLSNEAAAIMRQAFPAPAG
jgi:hypothetical protein